MNELSYDTLPYESLAIKETHPRHLYALGILYGLKPTPAEQASILELGCASGGNIIPMAFYMPHTNIVGIDLSPVQINFGNEIIRKLSLKNIFLQQQSILDFNEKQKYDYIICHGVYSWVEPATREKILTICRDNLAENGIAFISYNTMPGWMAGNVLRDMLLWHTENIHDPATKIDEAFHFLSFMQASIARDHSGYGSLMKRELDLVQHHSASHLIHEHLSTMNTPCYFYQFIHQARRHQLDFLCEAFDSTMDTTGWPQSFMPELQQMKDQVIAGQYLDFINNQRFRCTLLCHHNVKLQPTAAKESVKQYFQQWSTPSDLSPSISAQPAASLLARMQSQRNLPVTTPQHENIELTPVANILLPYLTGTHDFATLTQIVQQHLDEGVLVILDKNEREISDEQERLFHVQEIIQETLTLLAKKGLLTH